MPFCRLLLLCCVLSLFACADSDQQLDLSGRALGTTFTVSVITPLKDISKDALEAEIVAALQAVDHLASTWKADAELAVLNQNLTTDWIPVSTELCALLDDAKLVSAATGGAFDLTIGPLTNLWGFGPSQAQEQPPSASDIETALAKVDFEMLAVDCEANQVRKSIPDMTVDLSGWAKGFAVDQVARLLDSHAIENYLVEIGGELRAHGYNKNEKVWTIAIEAPDASKRVPQTILHIKNAAVATSGDYRNFFEHEGQRFSHTIDPRSGYPIKHDLAAVTVVHLSTAYADAMATALLVLGPDDGPALARRLGIAAYFLIRSETGIVEIRTPAFDSLAAVT